MLFAATISNAGFNMQKLSQRQKKQGNKVRNLSATPQLS